MNGENPIEHAWLADIDRGLALVEEGRRIAHGGGVRLIAEGTILIGQTLVAARENSTIPFAQWDKWLAKKGIDKMYAFRCTKIVLAGYTVEKLVEIGIRGALEAIATGRAPGDSDDEDAAYAMHIPERSKRKWGARIKGRGLRLKSTLGLVNYINGVINRFASKQVEETMVSVDDDDVDDIPDRTRQEEAEKIDRIIQILIRYRDRLWNPKIAAIAAAEGAIQDDDSATIIQFPGKEKQTPVAPPRPRPLRGV